MKFEIILTWSKIVAILVLGCAVYLDVTLKTEGRIFMFSLPFITAMIGIKQVFDRNK